MPAIDWSSYDKVLIGASIRYGHLNKKLYQFIETNLAELNEQKAAFFCVNLTARKPGKDTPEGSVYVKKFLTFLLGSLSCSMYLQVRSIIPVTASSTGL